MQEKLLGHLRREYKDYLNQEVGLSRAESRIVGGRETSIKELMKKLPAKRIASAVKRSILAKPNPPNGTR